MSIIVAFSDADEATIIASFASEQDVESWPHQGLVEESDDRWKSYSALFSEGTNLLPE